MINKTKRLPAVPSIVGCQAGEPPLDGAPETSTKVGPEIIQPPTRFVPGKIFLWLHYPGVKTSQ